MKIAGIDPSLTSAGVAVIDTEDRLAVFVNTVCSTGKRDFTWEQRYRRVRDQAADIIICAGLPYADLAVIEAPTLSQGRQGGHLDRHGLFWVLYDRLVQLRVPTLIVTASSRAKYATGKGNAPKDTVMLSAARRYPQVPITNNDEADAVVLAAMGARILGAPIEDSLPKTHTDACASYSPPPDMREGMEQ